MWNQAILVLLTVLIYCFQNVNHSNLLLKYKKLRFNIYYYFLHVICLFIAPFGWPIFILRPKHLWNGKFAAQVLKNLTKLYKVTWELRNGNILAEQRGAVIVSNHQSFLDILGMFNVWEIADKLVPIAKKEILYALPFGISAYLCGVIFIDRNNKEASHKVLNTIAHKRIKNKGKIWIFPEGTRNEGGGNLLPFKKGAFHLAVANQVPIIPVVFSPYYFIDCQKHIFDKGHVIIKCLEPVSTEGLTKEDLPELIEIVRNKMIDVYKVLSHEIVSMQKDTSNEFHRKLVSHKKSDVDEIKNIFFT